MEVITYILVILALFSTGLAFYYAYKLYRWEKYLQRTRIAIAYKGKVKMNPPLLDWLRWADMLEGDEAARGRAIYKMGGTTVAILKPVPRDHGKTVTRTAKEKP